MDRPNNEKIASWYPALFRTALRMTGSADDAADLTQQTFCKALSRWEQFDGKALATTWLYSILVNCVRDWARRKAVRGNQQCDPWTLTAVSAERLELTETLERQEELVRLRREIESLPGALRETFIAVVLDGYTYQQTSELLGIPVGTVGSRTSDARRRLNLAMRRMFPET